MTERSSSSKEIEWSGAGSHSGEANLYESIVVLIIHIRKMKKDYLLS